MTRTTRFGNLAGGDGACAAGFIVRGTSQATRELRVGSEGTPRLAILRGLEDVEMGLETNSSERVMR